MLAHGWRELADIGAEFHDLSLPFERRSLCAAWRQGDNPPAVFRRSQGILMTTRFLRNHAGNERFAERVLSSEGGFQMMKKLVLATAIVAFSTAAMAQQNPRGAEGGAPVVPRPVRSAAQWSAGL